MKSSLHSFLVLLIVCLPTLADDAIPGAPQRGPIALQNGTVHPMSGPAIEGATLLFDKGKLVAVGAKVKLPPKTKTVDITGKHVYPGLFEAHSRLGLTEVASVRATRDFRETGSINPNVGAHIAVNPDSALIPVTRSNGVLLALSAPSGGLISGTGSVLQLDGWTTEDLALKPKAVMQISWPRMQPVFRAPGDDAPDEQEEERDSALERIREFFADARAYVKARKQDASKQSYDIRFEAMRPILSGKMPMLVQANGLGEIQSAVMFAIEQKAKIIILGGYDAPQCAELLKKHKVPVIVSAVHRRPRRRSDNYDAPYTLPLRLQQAGIEYCISGTDRSETWNARNLPYEAARAVGFGLDRDEAMRAITLYPARILGVADHVGSLESGKDATLIVTTGDPLEAATQTTHAWVQGRSVDLSNKQTRLYRKYQQKYRQQKARQR